MSLKFDLIKVDGSARRGRVHTAHGDFDTPAFMAVGTAATVKALTMDMVRDTGTQVILGNTYHLMMRPGGDLVEKNGRSAQIWWLERSNFDWFRRVPGYVAVESGKDEGRGRRIHITH